MSHTRVMALALTLTGAAMVAAPSTGSAQGAKADARTGPAAKSTPSKTGHVAANGVNYYYEIHGQRRAAAPAARRARFDRHVRRRCCRPLAKAAQVIARRPARSRPHGARRAADQPHRHRRRPGRRSRAARLREGRRRSATRSAAAWRSGSPCSIPTRVRRLVVASAPYAQDGFYPEMLPQQAAVGAAMADMMKDTPMYKSYVAVAPQPQDFPRLLDRMGELMRKPYDWSEDVKKLQMPVMLVYGDSDMIRPEHIVRVLSAPRRRPA